MSRTAKPKPALKLRRNRPVTFAESLAAPVGLMPALAPRLNLPVHGLARRLQLSGVVGLWLMAAGALSVAVASFLAAPLVTTSVPGSPLATQEVAVEPLTPAQLTSRQTRVNATLGGPAYQAALGVSDLQPGYLPTAPKQAPAMATAPVQ